jgi:hypothetical protein
MYHLHCLKSRFWKRGRELRRGHRVIYALTCVAVLLTGKATAQQAVDTQAFDFKWIVLNDNRLFLNHENQNNFQREMCRALDCSSEAVPGPTLRYCTGYRVHPGAEYCDHTRYKRNDGHFYWPPILEPVKTAWDSVQLRYHSDDDYLGKKRTIRAWREGEPQSARCEWRLSGVDADFRPNLMNRFWNKDHLQ